MIKIIQSFWSGQQNIETSNFGWASPKFHTLSWILSCVQLSKFYDVELYTDNEGYEFLINKLNLPYKKVHIVLDELNSFHKDFWALPKIKTYSLQQGPFLHVDGDVFIWGKFPDDLLKSGVISQNLEITTDYYRTMWKRIQPHLYFVPEEIEGYVTHQNNFACNMGIFGGNDSNFLQKYAAKSFEFAEKNKSLPKYVHAGNFNIFFEQVLLFEMLMRDQKESNYLFNETSFDNNYEGFGSFDEVPLKRKYLHLLGDYKRSKEVCKQMESYVLMHYPEYFKKIIDLFPNDYNWLIKIKNYDFSFSENVRRIQGFVEYHRNEIESIKIENRNEYLFNRNLACISSQYNLLKFIQDGEDFYIKKLKKNYIKVFEKQSENFDAELIIDEIDDEQMRISIDEIDSIILEKASYGIAYSKLKNELFEMLDQDAVQMIQEFNNMIDERLSYYLKNRIILIYDIE
ncbi:DUF6734 family protein [Chryseobacterium sp. LAM-KRS1]|uniref:DUF6734 family protein n=1 Tax=Chryseobacterium sp. LAM-KRS1 TaxID=2715754 RepID=UPI0015570D74|nr:DUF6734 family protein [Chryseobacterium sp. LAM-KRS1]